MGKTYLTSFIHQGTSRPCDSVCFSLPALAIQDFPCGSHRERLRKLLQHRGPLLTYLDGLERRQKTHELDRSVNPQEGEERVTPRQ